MPIAGVAPATPALRAFVRTTLGCTCPEAVLEAVERGGLVVDGGSAGTRLVIGDRLLIYVVAADVDAARLGRLAAAGLRDRDGHGLNRFRLVIGLPAGAAPAGALDDAFATAIAGDPKAHLHWAPAGACEAV